MGCEVVKVKVVNLAVMCYRMKVAVSIVGGSGNELLKNLWRAREVHTRICAI